MLYLSKKKMSFYLKMEQPWHDGSKASSIVGLDNCTYVAEIVN